ncbi:MAG TPA: hypothetical protein VGR03_12325 [Candidatus Acidoferrum sp.]|nr:hypothetical protein [Candidatus Acidoferrum sp.]
MVKNLSPENFRISQLGDSPSRLAKVSLDAGPKRVALILDVSSNVTKKEWELETEMAASLVKHGRKDDRFQITLAGADVEVDEFAGPGVVGERLKKLASSRPLSAGPGEKLYDGILAAAKRMDPAQFGDALFFFGHVEDSGSTTDPAQVRELLLRNRFRLYGLSFTDPLRGKLPAGYNPNKPLPATIVPSKLESISSATGYFVSFHSLEALALKNQPALLKDFLAELYAGIIEPYRLRIPASGLQGPLDLKIELANAAERGIRPADVHYPQYVYACDLPTPSVAP